MLIKANAKIILASTSQIRKQILSSHGISFEAQKPIFDEDSMKHNYSHLQPSDLALEMAIQKALSISNNFADCYVIGSDQACEFAGQEISKSQNRQQAIDQLAKFSGNVHYQNNAVVVVKDSQIIFKNFTKVKLKMRNLTLSQIENYVDFDQSWGCAGSYKYESLGKHLFEEVDGDYFAVLGLNIQPLISFLHQKNIINI